MSWFSKIGRRRDNAPLQTPSSEGDDLVFERPRSGPSGGADDSLPRFRGSRLAGLGTHDSEQAARLQIRNAFTPSQPVNDRAMFAGRRDLLERLIIAVEDQQLHFVLFGDRGIGKTSILHVLSDLAVDADYLVTYISCGERMTFSDLARRIAQRIPLLFHSHYAPGSPEIERGLNLADILPEGDIDVSTFGEQLGLLSNTRVLMLLDEFDRAGSEDFRRSIAELIKNLSDSAAPAQVVIAGVAADLTELIAQIPSIRRNVLGVLVPNMTDDEVSEMLNIAEKKTGFTFNESARELLALASLGLPYLVGLIAQHAALFCAKRGELEIVKADIREAIRRARSELSGRISARTLHAIHNAENDDQLIELGKLGHAALRSGGVLAPTMVTEKMREEHDRGLGLIVPIEDDPLERWHFTDDGAAVYIWLSALSSE